MPLVTIIRSVQYEGRWRKMKIKVDGEDVGYVRDGQELTIQLDTGRHELTAKMDWCVTRLDLELLSDDEVLCLETGFQATGIDLLLHPSEAIFLSITDSSADDTSTQ